MKTRVTNDDIVEELFKRTGLPKRQLLMVTSDFFRSIYYFITNPEHSSKGILVRNCFKFRLNPGAVLRRYCRMVKYGSDIFYRERLIKLNKTLIEKNEYTQKQEESIKDAERYELGEESQQDIYEREFE